MPDKWGYAFIRCDDAHSRDDTLVPSDFHRFIAITTSWQLA